MHGVHGVHGTQHLAVKQAKCKSYLALIETAAAGRLLKFCFQETGRHDEKMDECIVVVFELDFVQREKGDYVHAHRTHFS
jgi:hypothetical protein